MVQAVGSIAAIGVAIAVPAIQHGIAIKRTRVAQELRAKALGLSLRAEVEVMGDRLNAVWDREHPDEANDLPGQPNSRELGAETMAALVISPTLESQLDTLHEMGDAGEAVLRCVHDLMRAKELATNPVRHGIVRTLTFEASRFYDYLWDATTATATAINCIDDHFSIQPRPRNRANTDTGRN